MPIETGTLGVKAMSRAAVLISLLLLVISLQQVVSGSPSAASPVKLTIAGGPPASPPMVSAELMAQLISANIPNVQATAVAAPGTGSPENLRLLAAGQVDITNAWSGGGPALEAFRGEGLFKGNPVPMRTLTPVYTIFVHLVALEGSGIQTLKDLRGKRVISGPPGSLSFGTLTHIAKAVGLNPDRDIGRMFLPPDAAVTALREGRADVFVIVFPLPAPWIFDLGSTPGVRARLISADTALAALREEQGNNYFRATIRKEFYPWLPADVSTLGAAPIWFVRPDFSPELAYQITKLIYEKRADLVKVDQYNQFMSFIGVAGRSPVPFHPGAIRYFKERGEEGF